MIRLLVQMVALVSLVLCAVWLGLLGGRLLFDPLVLPTTVRAAWSPSSASRTTVPAVAPMPLVGLSAVTARPLFFEGRQMPIDAPIAALAPPPVLAPPLVLAPVTEMVPVALPSTLKLLGVVDIDGRKQALISGATTQGDWLTAGDAIDGWVVATINTDGVALKHGSQSANLELYASVRND